MGLMLCDSYAANIAAIIAKAQVVNGGRVLMYQPESQYTYVRPGRKSCQTCRNVADMMAALEGLSTDSIFPTPGTCNMLKRKPGMLASLYPSSTMTLYQRVSMPLEPVLARSIFTGTV